MSKLDIIRAWKDDEYRESLSAADRTQLPLNPVGIIELNDQDLSHAGGGELSLNGICDTYVYCSLITYCPFVTIQL